MNVEKTKVKRKVEVRVEVEVEGEEQGDDLNWQTRNKRRQPGVKME